jgi:hypothetical protein
VRPIILFAGESEFKTEIPPNVFTNAGFTTYIESFKDEIFSDAEVDMLISQINDKRLEPGRETNQQHVKNCMDRKGHFKGAT